MIEPGPARARLDELAQQLDEATGPYPVIHLANGPSADDEPEDYSSERSYRRRVRRLERERIRDRVWIMVTNLSILSTWIVLWQNW